MYNEQAGAYDSTMVYAFTLLSIDPKGGTPSTSLGPKMGNRANKLITYIKKLRSKKFYRHENQIQKMVEVF